MVPGVEMRAARRNRLTVVVAAVAIAVAAVAPAGAGVLIEPRDAPEWQVSEWVNGDPGPLDRLKGQVVVILFFQLWCPESNDFGVPLFNRWNELWGDQPRVTIVGIHSVFEGHEEQTPAALKRFVEEWGIEYPVGIDAYLPGDDIPITMRRFEAQGTPQVVIVDSEGKIRFSHFGRFDPDIVESWVERLIEDGGDDRRSRRGRRR